MQVNVRMFALARQIAGCETVAVTLLEGATVRDLRLALAQQVPGIAGLLNQMMIAVNSSYAENGEALPDGAEVACIPPVSGGAWNG